VRHSRVRSLVTSALLVALLAASAWITLPLGPVPVTLQTLVVVLVALVCAPPQAAATLGGYLALGAAGVPVFSGAQGGLATLTGPTGGYLLGFLLGAIAGAAVVRAAGTAGGPGAPARSARVDALAAAVTLFIVYTCGVPWLAHSTGTTVAGAATVGVLPFLLPDAAKAAAAVAVAAVLRRAGVA